MKMYRLEGFDSCIVGVVGAPNLKNAVCYDINKILAKLMKDGDMTRDEAIEHFEFNIRDTNLGDGTPVFLNRLNIDQICHMMHRDDVGDN